MRVRAILDNPDSVLTPGLFGRVKAPGSLPCKGVPIPEEALVADQNRRLVMLVGEEGKLSAREVRPEPKIDGYRVIRKGARRVRDHCRGRPCRRQASRRRKARPT